MSKKVILEVRNLSKIFRSGKKEHYAVRDVSFRLEKGGCLGVIGERGSGKSTTARMVAGLLKQSQGEVIFHGKNMQTVFQNPVHTFSPRMTILEIVCEGLRYQENISKMDLRIKALHALEMVKLNKSYAERYRNELSGGECQRVAIARAIMSEPELLICDEATSTLDVSVQAQIMGLLQELQEELGMAYLFISHDVALVSEICEKIIVMKDGEIVEAGWTEEVISHPRQPYTQKLIQSVPVF